MSDPYLPERAVASEAVPATAMNDTNTPSAIYKAHLTTLRDIIATDRFGNSMPDSLVDEWLRALDPTDSRQLPVSPEVKGFYGGDLRTSISIELAHDSYKFIVHEFDDEGMIMKYATRMLLALGLLDMDTVIEKDANLASLALWHQALAMVRMPVYCGKVGKDGGELENTLRTYEAVRPKSSLPDSKVPYPARLKLRLSEVAGKLGNENAAAWLSTWLPQDAVDVTSGGDGK